MPLFCRYVFNGQTKYLRSGQRRGRGTFLREVFWLDLIPFLTYGYRPRFGDRRDDRRTARRLGSLPRSTLGRRGSKKEGGASKIYLHLVASCYQ